MTFRTLPYYGWSSFKVMHWKAERAMLSSNLFEDQPRIALRLLAGLVKDRMFDIVTQDQIVHECWRYYDE